MPPARKQNAPSPGTRTIRPSVPSAASPSPPRWPNPSTPMGPTRPTRSGISSPPTPNPSICASRESIRAAKTVSASPPSTRSTTTMKEPGSRSLNGPYREPWCRSGSVGRHHRRHRRSQSSRVFCQVVGMAGQGVPDRMPTGRKPPVGHQTVAPENQSQYQHHWTRYCRALDIICGALQHGVDAQLHLRRPENSRWRRANEKCGCSYARDTLSSRLQRQPGSRQHA